METIAHNCFEIAKLNCKKQKIYAITKKKGLLPASQKELPTTALEQGAQILGTLKYPIPIF